MSNGSSCRACHTLTNRLTNGTVGNIYGCAHKTKLFCLFFPETLQYLSQTKDYENGLPYLTSILTIGANATKSGVSLVSKMENQGSPSSKGDNHSCCIPLSFFVNCYPTLSCSFVPNGINSLLCTTSGSLQLSRVLTT